MIEVFSHIVTIEKMRIILLTDGTPNEDRRDAVCVRNSPTRTHPQRASDPPIERSLARDPQRELAQCNRSSSERHSVERDGNDHVQRR